MSVPHVQLGVRHALVQPLIVQLVNLIIKTFYLIVLQKLFQSRLLPLELLQLNNFGTVKNRHVLKILATINLTFLVVDRTHFLILS